MDNRTRFPAVALVVDQFRTAGIPVKVVYASEGGNEVGSRERHDEWERACVPVFADDETRYRRRGKRR